MTRVGPIDRSIVVEPAAGPAAGPAPPGRALLLPYATACGAENMALDEAMMALARAGRVALRFYGWSPHCLSLGRNQRAGGPLRGLEPGIDVVRRPTGGRSVFHGPELTYAVAFPERAWGGPRAAYGRVNAALAAGLRGVGVRVDPLPSARARARARVDPLGDLGAAACFADPAPGELTVRRRKLVGSAQWRHRGAILQHGSILIADVQGRGALPGRREMSTGAKAREGVSDSAPPQGPEPATSVGLDELLDETPTIADLGRALAAGFGSELQLTVVAGEASAGLRRAAGRLAARYRSAEWTWRR